ncbi:beta-ketoacyl-ACP synthase III [Krasilnikovia sp. M28-CT-15]|uniref:beta-ketoacyl-ACP synthase III n=1 Tax=Krasilnikovia sp. M28-CT-15 TaxID=3373540 RepID=UPI0038766319
MSVVPRAGRRAAIIQGLGTFLPERVVTNAALSERLDTTDEWIRSRTGIRERRWAESGTATGDLAVEAGARALKAASMSHVDVVVLATTTPDHPCPGTAPAVAARLGLGHAMAFDVSAVCTGFIYALATASSLIVAGLAESALVIGAETYSTILNPEDRSSAVIFGDGAGAAVLTAGDLAEPGALLGFDLGSDGEHADLITVPAGGSRQRAQDVEPDPADFYFTMRGREVFTHAVTRMGQSSKALLDRIGWPTASVDHLVGHQANVRILQSLADFLDIERRRAVVNLDRVGNTSAASIPLALADAVRLGTVQAGDRVLLSAFGGGLTWGSTALIWPEIESC